MADQLKNRNEVDVSLTWDLSLIFRDETEYNKAVERFTQLGEAAKAYKGRLKDAESLAEIAGIMAEISILSDHIGNYTGLAVEVDYTDSANQDRSARASDLLTQVYSELSFVDGEISACDEAVIKAAAALKPEYRGYFDAILRNKPHLLGDEAEKVIAAMSPTISAPYAIYNNIKLADMDFPSFEVNGTEYPLGYSKFEDDYEYETDTDIRRAAYRAFYDHLDKYKNGTAAAFNAHLTQERIMASLRGYENLEAMNLHHQRVTREMYDRQIDVITERLAPHMRKLAKLIKRIYKLDKMTYADLKLPIDPGYNPTVSIAEAQKMIAEGLSVMGEDYVSMINEAFEKRWIDFAQNKGKCTGGFCASPYRKNSFILFSWYGRMSDVLTLAHELGHAGHFRMCSNEQSPFDTDVSSYFVEAPSTMNEMLLSHYMIKTNPDKRFRRWVLANMVCGTYYHNCVTHLLEGAYQREVNKIIQSGGSVQADVLSGIFKNVLEKFWGEEVELTEGAELTWMRQPHYYMGLYSYTYSAGLTVATQMCKRIEREGAPAVEDWKKVLSAGSTLPPLELAKLGGIDISTDAALIDTIDTIGSYIDEMIKLTDELGE